MARIFITGSSKGLGRAAAIELARRGHEVIATARKVETLGPETIAKGIADAVESKDTKLRWPLGDDAVQLLALRHGNDDAAFEKKFREVLKLTW